MKQFILLLLCLFGALKVHGYESSSHEITIQNAVVANVMGKPITVLDLVKKMDRLLQVHYPDYIKSPEAKFQFYRASWRRILDDTVNTELMLLDAADRDMKLSDGEVREEVEKRYGPNVLLQLQDLGMSYEEAFKQVKDEMIVQRISWYYIHGKAYQSVTPKEIRKAYSDYKIQNPPKDEWTYQIITLQPTQENTNPEEFVQYCQMEKLSSEDLLSSDSLTEKFPVEIKVSDSYTVDFKDLSDKYKNILAELPEGEYSKPLPSRKKDSWKVFYLQKKEFQDAPSLQEIYKNLSDQLLEKHVMQNSQDYIQKLRRHYHYSDQEFLDNFEPFSIQPFTS